MIITPFRARYSPQRLVRNRYPTQMQNMIDGQPSPSPAAASTVPIAKAVDEEQLVSAFEAQVRRTPAAPALRMATDTVSFD